METLNYCVTKSLLSLHIEVVEWSARLARKRAIRVRCLLAPLSMMHIPLKHRDGRVVSASGSETSVSGTTPASAIIYDAYTAIKKEIKTPKCCFVYYCLKSSKAILLPL